MSETCVCVCITVPRIRLRTNNNSIPLSRVAFAQNMAHHCIVFDTLIHIGLSFLEKMIKFIRVYTCI
jgi:hypothetical protein